MSAGKTNLEREKIFENEENEDIKKIISEFIQLIQLQNI